MGRVSSFFGALLRRDASGQSWLPGLLAATPHAPQRLGGLVAEPGWLVTPLAVATANGELGAFTYSATPARELLSWYFEHPDALVWPPGARMSAATTRLRRALIDDDPPGARAGAQERARELIRVRSPFSREWWRFEATARLDCVLVTDRLVVTVRGLEAGSIPPATDWYPVGRSWWPIWKRAACCPANGSGPRFSSPTSPSRWTTRTTWPRRSTPAHRTSTRSVGTSYGRRFWATSPGGRRRTR